jgi:hypothetical protein
MAQAPLLWAKSVKGLRLIGNMISIDKTEPNWHQSDTGLTFLDCEDVEVSGNSVSLWLPAPPSGSKRESKNLISKVKIQGGKPETIKVSGWN